MTLPSPDSRNWAMAAHLAGGFAGLLIPLGNLLAPLGIWLVKKDEDAFVGESALEALNFQLSVTLALLLCVPLVFLLVGIPLMLAVGIGGLVFSVVAAIAASRGDLYRYPYTLRLVKGDAGSGA